MKIITCISAFVLLTSVAMADGLSYSQKRELKNQGYSSDDIREIERGNTDVEPTYKYQSLTGNKYKYDLSDPADRIEYSVDPESQLYDRVNPIIEIDRNLGQYGGGIQND